MDLGEGKGQEASRHRPTSPDLQVLPERSSAAPGMVSVMLDGAGRVAPASPSAVAAAAAAQGRQGSHHLLPDLETASRRLDDAPAGVRNIHSSCLQAAVTPPAVVCPAVHVAR